MRLRYHGSAGRGLVLATLLLAAGCAGAPATPFAAAAQRDAEARREFEAMLATVDAAQHELQQGRPEVFKSLWSHTDDVTLAGGLGGPVVRGWEDVGRRLDWAGTQFSRGQQTKEVLSMDVRGELGYVVQLEHLRFHAPGEEEESVLNYRVTMVFRREAGQWRIVHRHADQNLTRTPTR